MLLFNVPVYTVVLIITGSIGCFMFWKFYKSFLKNERGTRVRRAGANPAAAAAAGARRRAAPNIPANRRPPAARMRHRADEDEETAARVRLVEPNENHDGSDDAMDDDNAKATKKVGAKKAAKLAEKERRKEDREADERYRENTRKLEDEEIAKRKKAEEEEEKIAAAAIAAEEKRREEEAIREQAEYERMKLEFSVEEEGTEIVQRDNKAEAELNAQLCAVITEAKIIAVEHLALEFSLKTEACVDRLKSLLSSGQLSGLMDDRGKFVHITLDEYEAVARFIDKRGRVTLAELVDNGSKLLNLSRRV